MTDQLIYKWLMSAGLFAGIFILGECFSNLFIFRCIKRAFLTDSEKPESGKITQTERWMGVIERFMLFFAMSMDIFHILIAFGTMKIATSLTIPAKKVDTGYFLAGNFVSIILSLGYYRIFSMVTALITGISGETPSTAEI